jgi:hypothetical protein
MKRALCSPYSPDLSPSYFHLFGHVKKLLRGHEFTDQEALLHAVEDILRGIEKVIMEDVFLSWMERLRQYGNAAGEYSIVFLISLKFSKAPHH